MYRENKQICYHELRDLNQTLERVFHLESRRHYTSFFRLQVYERVGILLVEVYERVG